MTENRFETELIQYITTGTISNPKCLEGIPEFTAIGLGNRVVKTKLWKYEPDIKTTPQLWDNFKKILEQHNQNVLENPMSDAEFNQVKKIISDLHTPYEAGQFLYGLNGVSQIEVDLDDGRHVFLTVFDQKQIGAGDTVYQVVNQIERPAVINGKMNRRFDTTLLINGLPIIQIEEKRDTHDVNEALNQMHQYIDEGQYGDIFSMLQILIAITPNNVKYMANTTSERFNKDFAFNWQREDNTIVRDWKEFVDSMLSIPMAHQMATNYMILDGTPNKQSLKVMRPYQVYATQAVIEGLKNVDFEFYKNLHKYVFGDIYEWAGTIRTVDMSKKGTRFCPADKIEERGQRIFQKIINLNFLGNIKEDEFIVEFTDLYCDLNYLHPFREGNGRATRIWLDLILKKNLQRCIDWSQVDKRKYLEAMTRSVADPTSIKDLLRTALTDKINDRDTFMKGIDYSYYYEQED